MAFSLGILAAIVSFFAWGVADFLTRGIVMRMGPLRSLFWVQLFGILALLPLLLIFPVSFPSGGITFALILLAGVLEATGTFAFYRAFAIGKVSIVAPVVGSASAVTVILGLLILGEALSPLQAAAVALLIVGIALASFDLNELRHASRRRLSAGVPEALYSMLGWGVMWFLIAFAERSAAWLFVILAIRALTVISTAASLSLKGEGLLPEKLPWKAILPIGILDAAALAAFGFGVASEFASLVTPIANAYPALTVLLALLILRERPARSQLLGILAILAGVVAISL